MANDTVFRMACAIRLHTDKTLSRGERAAYQRALGVPSTIPCSERAQFLAQLLSWFDAYDARCAAVVRQALTGEDNVPWRGHRSTEGMMRVATIVERLREEQEAPKEMMPRGRKRRGV